MAEMKRVTDGVYQFMCDCGQWIHTFKMVDDRMHIESEQIKTGKEKDDAPPKKKPRGFFTDFDL